MTQQDRSGNSYPQAVVFLLIIIALLAFFVVGSGQSSAPPAATVEATSEAPAPTPAAEVTAEPTMDMSAPTAEAVAPRVFFRVPTDNAIVPPSFTVKMGAEGLTVEPAGDVHADAGHFHILIDTPFINAGQVIPKDATHLHFGDASTETTLELTPGDHVLRLQFADGAHTALEGDQYRAEIHVTVVEGAPEQSVRFVTPSDGATVPQTFDVVMAAAGLEVMPAGAVEENAGHFHILIDAPFIEAGQVVPKDDTHLHFGMGQLSTQLTLTPGQHTLRLQFANGAHIALDGDQYRDEITITVQ